MKLRLTPGWAVSTDADGSLYLIDGAGMRPLEHPDPIQRLFAFHLAAAAPELRNSLQDLVRRFEHYHPLQPQFERRDGRMIQIAHGAIVYSRPCYSELERALANQRREEQQKRAA